MATWPNSNASQGKFTKHSSGNIGSVGSPGHASTLQATDQETDPSSHRRRQTPHHHPRSLHNLAKLIARDKAVSTFWNCTRKPPKREQVACYFAVARELVWGLYLNLTILSRVDIACHTTSLYHSFSCQYSMSYDISISVSKKNLCKTSLEKH
jgi:hypothetical protein